jgi:mannose-1-phosphate guanylyltransferase/mannose-6-phosphate isomerase
MRTAISYLAGGFYAWNSGLFVLKISIFLEALAQFRPDIVKATDSAWSGKSSVTPFVRPDVSAFASIPSESVDYGVIE